KEITVRRIELDALIIARTKANRRFGAMATHDQKVNEGAPIGAGLARKLGVVVDFNVDDSMRVLQLRNIHPAIESAIPVPVGIDEHGYRSLVPGLCFSVSEHSFQTVEMWKALEVTYFGCCEPLQDADPLSGGQRDDLCEH